MLLHMKIRPGPTTRSSGQRQRSAAAIERRNKRKAEKGWGPLAEEAAPGRSSGSRNTQWNRSSGSGDTWWTGWGGSEWWAPSGGSSWWQTWQPR